MSPLSSWQNYSQLSLMAGELQAAGSAPHSGIQSWLLRKSNLSLGHLGFTVGLSRALDTSGLWRGRICCRHKV